MKKHNIFITFEGGEGSGKTTVAQIVANKLEKQGQSVFLTREPGGGDLEFSEKIREIIMNSNDIDPITELLLFNASRREHVVKRILPELNAGKLVISDRFSDSTIVYQGIGKGVDIPSIISANDIAVQGNYPSLVFIFDISPAIALKRIKNNNREVNRFDREGEIFHKKIRQGYIDLAKKNDKYIIIDASKSVEDISNFIIKKIKEYGNKIN